MKLGRVVLFVQFAALWKICPSFHPVSKLLEKKKKKKKSRMVRRNLLELGSLIF